MHPIQGIYALCDNTFAPKESHGSLAKKFLQGGIRILQLRMKGEENLDHVLKAARDILALKRQYDFTFILNDFVELGVELGVDAVHVGQDDLPVSQVKKMTQDKILVGYSSHSLTEAQEAQDQGADYVALGAIFPTPTKGPGHPVVGLKTLKQLVDRLKIPVVAIGGITE
ncbi:MAG: thiamine phosphate synthase, partial [bacterium]|nr:thiamine phosphate synthase [bacterium]